MRHLPERIALFTLPSFFDVLNPDNCGSGVRCADDIRSAIKITDLMEKASSAIDFYEQGTTTCPFGMSCRSSGEPSN